MNKLDEKIISMKNQQRNKDIEIDIKKGVYIDHSFVQFVDSDVLGGSFTVMIPSAFREMTSEEARNKYHSELRPQCIKTSPDTSINLCISLIADCPITEETMKLDAMEMKNALQKTNPAMEFYESGIEQLEDFKLAWFEFKSFALDGQMYNLMFLAPAKGQMLHGVFNCMFESSDNWKEPALQMVKSIKYAEKSVESTESKE